MFTPMEIESERKRFFGLPFIRYLFSSHQREEENGFELSFWEDMSLSEIAEHTGTTRQGVRELIKRTCDELEEYERLMHLKNTRDRLFEIADGTEDKDLAEKIRKVLE